MHETFYIDADEEVNSIISRLRKSTSQYNVLVIAKQALILQSSVSLKLIKKEMDALKKKVMIVTQDEYGLAMAKKAGFSVKKTIDEINSGQGKRASQVVNMSQENMTKEDRYQGAASLSEKNRLKNLGDNNYSAIDEIVVQTPIQDEKNNKVKKEIIINTGLDEIKDKEFDNLFVQNNSETKKPKETKNVGKSAGKFLWIFSFVSVVVIVGIFIYLFFPKAEIVIIPKKSQKNINLTIKAQESSQEDDLLDIIILKPVLFEEEEVFSMTAKATGQKSSANKKARGVITIYNNFSETSQILVATTRFLSEDGKLFRLTKNVTVPGIVTENDKKITGEIKAEVIADQPGSEYNIDSTTFKIPGFEGGPKYDKFSAKSEEKMKGGGEGGSDFKTISQEDIDNAKKESLEKIKSQLEKKIIEDIGNEYAFLEDAIEYEILDTASFPEVGAIADDFEYQLKVKAKYITFSNDELENELNSYIDKNIISTQESPLKVLKIEKEFNESESDFVNNSINTKVSMTVFLIAEVDGENIKQGLLGKNQEEVDEFIKEHPEIQKIDAEISPNFLAKKIPKYSSRVDLVIDNEK